MRRLISAVFSAATLALVLFGAGATAKGDLDPAPNDICAYPFNSC